VAEQPPVEQATANPGEQRITARGRVPGLPEEPGETRPLPNQADTAWADLQRLQAEAAELGLNLTGREPLGELRRMIDEAKAR
jgi:hypothetical protein